MFMKTHNSLERNYSQEAWILVGAIFALIAIAYGVHIS